MDPLNELKSLWSEARLPLEVVSRLVLSGSDPVLPSSFAIGGAAQVSMAAAALAAAHIGDLRNGVKQRVSVDMREAALECSGYFSIDGQTESIWDKIAGIYPCGQDRGDGAGFVRLHTNFEHHRDGVLHLLGLTVGPNTSREQVAEALRTWRAAEFEQAGTDAGLVVAMARSFDDWDQHPQASVIANQPLITFERLGDANPQHWPALPPKTNPLQHLRVLDLTRILAGPRCWTCDHQAANKIFKNW